MPGKGYKPADPELKEHAREMRKAGQTVEAIAVDLGVSTGSVSGWCRDIPAPARRTQREAAHSTKDTTGPVVGGPYDEDTKDLANQVKKAKLQAELDEIDDRKRQRQELEDLRLRERKLMLELDGVRAGASKGDGAVVAEITELRGELSELREARHRAELSDVEFRHAAELKRLDAQIAAASRTGLSPYDLMSHWSDKVENLLILVSEKIEKAVSRHQVDGALKTALRLGISPAELEILTNGPELIPTREEYDLGRRYRAHRDGVALTEPEPGEYEGIVSLVESRNRRYEAAMAKVNQKMGQGKYYSGNISPGKTPEPGQPEPTVLPAESRLVTCSRCGTTFDIDLVEARQAGAAGKRLFVNCANPKCNFLLDLTDLLPELAPAPQPAKVAAAKPDCYIEEVGPGQKFRCALAFRGQGMPKCSGCQWQFEA